MKKLLILAFVFTLPAFADEVNTSTPAPTAYSYMVLSSTFTGTKSVLNLIAQDVNLAMVSSIVDTVTSGGRVIKVQNMFPCEHSYTTFTVTGNGYIALSDGQILQWGQAECGTVSTEITFPAAFAKTPEPVAVQVLATTVPAVSQTSARKFSVTCAEAVTVFWLAAGR